LGDVVVVEAVGDVAAVALAVDEPEVGLRIVAAIWRYWQLTSQHAEGAMWARDLLAHPAADGDPRVRIGGLAAAGGLGYWANDFVTARSAYDQRLGLAEELGDEAAIAEAHYDVGFIGMVDQDIEFLRLHEAIALASFERLGATDGIVRARQALVLGHFLDREYEQARALEVLNLAEFQRSGSRYRMADSLALLSVASVLSGDVAGGRDYLERSGRLASSVLSEQVAGLVIASHIALRAERLEDGARLAGAAQAITDETGVTNATLRILHVPDPLDLARESIGEGAEGWIAEGRSMTLDIAIALARRVIADDGNGPGGERPPG